MTNFKNLQLNEKILNALEKKGYNDPTPIQLQAIPHVLEGKDLLGIAQTGTGKTAAFSLPILHNLAKGNISVKSGGVRVLILTPTRELASQIADNIEVYGKELGLKYAVIFGGVSENPQIKAVQGGVDILIATPGRLLDLTNQGYIRYMQLEVLVLDEADRMLDMGFINDIKKIIQKIPEKRQTLFFSATMPTAITGLANSILKNPVRVEVTPSSSTAERIEQKVFLVDKSHKLSLLKKVVKEDGVTSALVFCKTKHGANKVVEFLSKNAVTVAAIHGNKSQGAREKALLSFRNGQIKILVATDIAARGIDIPAISHVINYDIPLDPESYVHRIGRTARAGRDGLAISFCDPSETKYLRDIEKIIKAKITVDETHQFHGVEAAPMQRMPLNRDGAFKEKSSSPYARNGGGPNPGRKYGFAVNKARKIEEVNSKRRDEEGGDDRRPRNTDRRREEDKGKKKFFGFIGFGRRKTEERKDSKGFQGGIGGFEPRNERKSDSRSDKRPNFRDDKRPSFRDADDRRPSSRGADDRRPSFRDREVSGNSNERERFNSRDERRPARGRSDSNSRQGDDKKSSFGFSWFKKKGDESSEKRPFSSSDRRPPRKSGSSSSNGNFKPRSGSSNRGPRDFDKRS